MGRSELVLIYVSLIITQLVVVFSDDIDYTLLHDDMRKLGEKTGIRKKCLAENSDVTVSMLEQAELGEFPDNNNLACYFKCVVEKAGLMKKDGKINFKLLLKMIPTPYKKIANDMFEECLNIEGSDNCEKAYNLNKCLHKANPVAYFVI
ncbi:general odorant-binding protein 56h-like [Odontomachus brunneus]|uniref:general odorant-binding protein 56h-like n=1 Tax=Odontomachus brunneus TaxID=486640 RepID=UPI0013F1B276|nr:general odorant-binding protein 56h-like [Odontomachus brunneus]